MPERLERLRKRLRRARLDALLVTKPENIRYLCGFTGSTAELLVTADGDGDVLTTDGRYAEQAADEAIEIEVIVLAGGRWLKERLANRWNLGLEADAISWQRADKIKSQVPHRVVQAPGHVEALRQRKDAPEISALRRACDVADQAFAELLGWITPGLRERDVAVRLERTMLELGADDRSFSTIVAAGANSALPHHRAGAAILARGDIVKIDFGALVDGYHSDITRMVSLGPPPAQLKDVYDVVRHAQEAGVAAARPGAESSAVDAACRDIITAAGYGDRFVHGTGHGVGLEIHEDPYLRPAAGGAAAAAGPSVTLAERMTVTVEPGVYLPGIGGVRIEDSLVVTGDSADVLTKTSKELVIL
jgi:Xaa-Pro aminopeptidase